MSLHSRKRPRTVFEVASSKAGGSHAQYNESEQLVSVDEYRKLMNDETTTDERIQERIAYLARYTRKIIKTELEKLWQK